MTSTTEERFSGHQERQRAGMYAGYQDTLWPPFSGRKDVFLDLSPITPHWASQHRDALIKIRDCIEQDLALERAADATPGKNLPSAEALKDAMMVISRALEGDDARALRIRATALSDGYSKEDLEQLTHLREDTILVAGRLSTWFGKDKRRLPSAFGARIDEQLQNTVNRVCMDHQTVQDYLKGLHPDLTFSDPPVFAAMQIFFCAGEANSCPKHIAYFLPEDEGVKWSPYKKTYYFANTHRALLEFSSKPLADAHLDITTHFDPLDPRFAEIPTLGVLGHEFGHFVRRPSTSFTELGRLNRWASVALQEIAADVFGVLVLAEIWAAPTGLASDDVLAYYLAECLRYVSRGLGYFPDSDGMAFQLEYLCRVGALALSADGTHLVGDTGAILAGLRSLARVLADHLLNDDAAAAIEIFKTYGPSQLYEIGRLLPQLNDQSDVSVHYRQAYVSNNR
ncbi:Uncharacterised protein [Mycobacteroides abscessus subsp. bolletii]|uniref:hypothetical protein n=1 Tax=Mycobacteroides abscessus TaxID=36809 RepID=UPI000926DE9D|nr:hypothetical protein [Mycobacteroides abscessus]SIK04475.1 Uncharacterised protein [Mycobacteroides abscessus subsp. bolletii]